MAKTAKTNNFTIIIVIIGILLIGGMVARYVIYGKFLDFSGKEKEPKTAIELATAIKATYPLQYTSLTPEEIMAGLTVEQLQYILEHGSL